MNDVTSRQSWQNEMKDYDFMKTWCWWKWKKKHTINWTNERQNVKGEWKYTHKNEKLYCTHLNASIYTLFYMWKMRQHTLSYSNIVYMNVMSVCKCLCRVQWWETRRTTTIAAAPPPPTIIIIMKITTKHWRTNIMYTN